MLVVKGVALLWLTAAEWNLHFLSSPLVKSAIGNTLKFGVCCGEHLPGIGYDNSFPYAL